MEDFPNLELDEAIVFHQEDIAFELPQVELFIHWINVIITAEDCELNQLNYIFCSDNYLHQLNVEYLDHDTLTDVITFPYASPPIVEGDIFISIERIEDNAKKFKTSSIHELARVMIHGVLHLCGYGDKSETEQKIMRSKENTALAKAIKYGIKLA